MTYLKTDYVTKGNWKGVYGGDGYNVVTNAVSYPSYATVTPSGTLTCTWASSTSDSRGLQLASGAGRVAACWYTQSSTAGSTYTIDVNLTDGKTHSMALYAVDWDGSGPRSENISLVSASSGQVLDSRTLVSFEGGEYLLWNVTGHVKIVVDNLAAGTNAVVSGLFFAPAQSAASASSSAAFVKADTSTEGNWQGVYGADGFNIVNGTSNYPAYSTVLPEGSLSCVWSQSTSDPSALQMTGSSGRIASCWYSQGLAAGNDFLIDVNLTDQKAHNVAVYMLDWDGLGPRAQQVQVLDAATGAFLDTRTVSTFENGEYLVWTLTGHVIIQVTNEVNGSNAVASGIFFGQ